MQRFKTRHEYHGATLREAAWMDSGDLVLTLDLDGQWTSGLSLRITLVFYGVQNRPTIEEVMRELAVKLTGSGSLGDVLTFRKDAGGSFLLDTRQGALLIDASSFAEL